MAGNEIEAITFLFENIDKLELPHLGVIKSIGAPRKKSPGFDLITSKTDILRVSPPNSGKKADIYVNGLGVSIKQAGGSFAFNRIQRANIQDLFNFLKISDPPAKLSKLDEEIEKFHKGELKRRNRHWEDFFEENTFKKILKFLMMKGSPNLGISQHPAELILEAPMKISKKNVSVYSFSEYFNKYKTKLRIAIRRQWVGQASKSEHGRAKGLCKKSGNSPWIYDGVVGTPKSGWKEDFPKNSRKTVYFLMVEKT